MNKRWLKGVRVLNLSINVPGPLAAARLLQLGASVTKIEPPAGDPLEYFSKNWYLQLIRNQNVVKVDLSRPRERLRLEKHLAKAHLLITATRPATLKTWGLGWRQLHARHPHLCQVALVGHPPPEENKPGHDLTYQAAAGLLDPPHVPRGLFADFLASEQAVGAALALLWSRHLKRKPAGFARIAHSDSADFLADSLKYDVTTPAAVLGGGTARYNLYPTRKGWIALAALEEKFWKKTQQELHLKNPSYAVLKKVFLKRPAREWERWASKADIPLVECKTRW